MWHLGSSHTMSCDWNILWHKAFLWFVLEMFLYTLHWHEISIHGEGLWPALLATRDSYDLLDKMKPTRTVLWVLHRSLLIMKYSWDFREGHFRPGVLMWNIYYAADFGCTITGVICDGFDRPVVVEKENLILLLWLYLLCVMFELTLLMPELEYSVRNGLIPWLLIPWASVQ